MGVASVKDADFANEVLQADLPVIVDFWAEWCGPCKMLAPTLDELAKDYAGKVKIVKLNVDENQESAAQCGIRALPTLIMFKNGEAVSSQRGVQSKSSLSKWIDGSL